MPTDHQMQDDWRSNATEHGELCVIIGFHGRSYASPALCLDLGKFAFLLTTI